MHEAAGENLRYGAAQPVLMKKVPGERLSITTVIALVAGPALVFAITAFARLGKIHFVSNSTSWAVEVLVLIFICILCCAPAWDFATSKGRLWTFALATGLYAELAGVLYGQFEYEEHFKPYYDINALNAYKDVEVNYYPGQTLMDAGIVNFVPGTRLNLSLSYGFKNDDTYCVAPIVPLHARDATNETDGFRKGALPDTAYNSQNNSVRRFNGTNPTAWGKTFEGNNGGANYDFWAIGLNCCSAHGADFQCGEFDNINARSGLRLMRDDLRGYFKLAVEEATAAYNIQAVHPVFMYWMESPEYEVENYLEDGQQAYISGVIAYIVWQSLLTLVAMNKFI